MKYTKEQLNKYVTPSEGNLVVHITSEKEYLKLKVICPNLSSYESKYTYYFSFIWR